MINYNILIQYANFRKEVVSNVPTDICFNELDLNDEQKDLIIIGLPLLRDCILSIYDNVIEYARSRDLSQINIFEHIDNGTLMKARNEARIYMDNVFYTLLTVLRNGFYNEYNNTISAFKNDITNNSSEKHGIKFQQSLLFHFDSICRVEYQKNNEVTSWKKCDNVQLKFDNKALCFILNHIIKNMVNHKYFKYGDFPIYTKSGQAEDQQNKFPNSVRLKALGVKKYDLYQTLCHQTQEILDIEQTGENTYQGGGSFQIICEYGNIAKYKNTYENTIINITIKKDRLYVFLRLDFSAFHNLPQIFGELSSNIKNGFLELSQCSNCKFQCKRKRIAVFDESIFPNKVLMPCKWPVAVCNIENENDMESISLIFAHIKKYTKSNIMSPVSL